MTNLHKSINTFLSLSQQILEKEVHKCILDNSDNSKTTYKTNTFTAVS
jgi:hypothetical protein